MNPIDFRKDTFERLKTRISGLRNQTYRAWVVYGPGTTADVCAKARMSILTFRPRTTELVEMGLVILDESAQATGKAGRQGNGGVYRARTYLEWRDWIAAQRGAVNSQLQLM
jgi:hypothetical protein